MYQLKIKNNDRISKVGQIVNAVIKDIKLGVFPKGAQLPSINQFSLENKVARDTVEKAYRELKRKGHITSSPGRGYFVMGRNKKQPRVLLIFNKLSSFKKIIYENFISELGIKAKVDVQIHHYDPERLREIIQDNLGAYDFFVIMPHFFSHSKEKKYLEVIKMIPPHELVLLDKNLPQLKFPYRSVYQDFREDIYQALCGLAVLGNIKDTPLIRNSVYIVTDEDNLAFLLKNVRGFNFKLRRDIGIISFNDTVFKELLDITVISTDFAQMGRTTAKLILGKESKQYNNPFYLIKRGSL